jgi:hypothetical protein
MEEENRAEFQRVWEKIGQFDQDSRTLIVVKEAMTYQDKSMGEFKTSMNDNMSKLGKQVNRQTLAAGALMLTVIADLVVRLTGKG